MNKTNNTLISELDGIYGLWHVPFWQQSWFVVVCALVTLCVAAVIIYFFMKFYASKKRSLSPADQALLALDQLEKILIASMSEPYYVQLTDILKQFIGAQAGTDICSFTDDEVCLYIDVHSALTEHKERLRQLFTAGSLIKFACHGAIERQMIDDLQYAKAFVLVTKEIW